MTASIFAWAGPVVVLSSNGQVVESPLFPYIGNGYNGDVTPGDNDLPWLRQYAINHGIFDGIDMTADWKDREWQMIRAIIDHTAYLMTWTGGNSIDHVSFRTQQILTLAQNNPDSNWGCQFVAAAAIGLAQAQGIPARFVGGISTLVDGRDNCLEVFSTKYNRWVFLFPHTRSWIEDDTGPLGVRELQFYDLAGGINYHYVWNPNLWNVNTQSWGLHERLALPYPPLVFLPTISSNAPIVPHASSKWWRGYFWHMRINYQCKVNSNKALNPWILKYVVTDQFAQDEYGFSPPVPIINPTSLHLNHPLNNVEANVALIGDVVRIQLVNNMFDFVRYEMRIDDDAWGPLTLPETENAFLWTPAVSSILSIRGVNDAGVHSPDVVIEYFQDLCCDLDGDGDIDLDDYASFADCMFGPVMLPDPPGPLTAQSCLDLADHNSDGFVDLRDLAAFQRGLAQTM